MTVPRRRTATSPAPTPLAAPRERLLAEIRQSAVADRLTLGRIVVRHAERLVAEGCFDGRPCFMKLYTGRNVPAAVRRGEAAFAEAWPHMSDGIFRIPRPLFAARRRGFLVLDAAPGTSLEETIAEASVEGREGLVRLAGGWLAAFCAPRRETRPFSPERFLAFHVPRMETPGWKGQLRDSRQILLLREYLADMALGLGGAPVSIAVTHGDFVARNLHHDRGMIHGFDLDGTRALPVAWDLGLFLVEAVGREGDAGQATRYGVRAADIDALAASGVVDQDEVATFLRLFIGHHLLRRSIRMGPEPPFLDNVMAAAGRFMDSAGA